MGITLNGRGMGGARGEGVEGVRGGPRGAVILILRIEILMKREKYR